MRLDLQSIEAGLLGVGKAVVAGASLAEQQTQALIDAQPEAALLPMLLRRYVWNVREGAAAEAVAAQQGTRLRRVADADLPPLPERFAKPSKGGCIAAAVGPVGSLESYLPDTEAEVQCIRAAANFYRRPWFDSAAVRRAIGGRQGLRGIEYAQVRLLFTYAHSEGAREIRGS